MRNSITRLRDRQGGALSVASCFLRFADKRVALRKRRLWPPHSRTCRKLCAHSLAPASWTAPTCRRFFRLLGALANYGTALFLRVPGRKNFHSCHSCLFQSAFIGKNLRTAFSPVSCLPYYFSP